MALIDNRKNLKKFGCFLLIAGLTVGCGGGSSGGGSGTNSSSGVNSGGYADRGGVNPASLNLVLPKTDPSNTAVLPTGEMISTELVSVSFFEGVSGQIIDGVIAATGGTLGGVLPEVGYYIKFSPPKTVPEIQGIIAGLRKDPNVETAGFEYIYKTSAAIPPTDIQTLSTVFSFVDGKFYDARYGFQQIKMPEAWQAVNDSGRALRPVTVAVIDTGIDPKHPDLASNVASVLNGKEAWDFGDNDPDFSYDTLSCSTTDHGTGVSGVVAATIDGTGINGVAPTARIFPLKWTQARSLSQNCANASKLPVVDFSIAYSVTWARLAGANIINMSLGGTMSIEEYKQTLSYKAIKKAIDAGVVVIAAAGNDSCESENVFPAAMEGVISVGAVESRNAIGELSTVNGTEARSVWKNAADHCVNDAGSNFSDNPNALWVAAPGTHIYTTDISTAFNYQFVSGTSIATPFVSGLTALLKQIEPSLTVTSVADIIRNTADDISVRYPNGQNVHTWKRINAQKAVQRVLSLLQDSTAPSVPSGVVSTMAASNAKVELSWQPSSDNVGVAGYKVYRNGAFLRAVASNFMTDGGLSASATYCYKVSAYDSAGNESVLSAQTCSSTNASSSGWAISTIDYGGGYVSMAVDRNNKLHLAYYEVVLSNSGFASLKYATNASGAWVTSVIENSVEQVGAEWPPAIAVDSSGKAHVTYYHSSANALRYATNASGTWAITDVDGNFTFPLGTGVHTSIAADSNNKAHISYSASDGFVMYATNASGAWVKSAVGGAGVYATWYNTIAVDLNNKVHIGFLDQLTLKYLTNASGAWVETPVDTSTAGWDARIAVDSAGKAHFSYYAGMNRDIFKYATNASGAWVTSAVDMTGASAGGGGSSIAVGPDNRLHLSYYNSASGDLWHAINSSGSWSLSLVDSNGDVGRWSTVAIDFMNIAQISYYDSLSAFIKHAKKQF